MSVSSILVSCRGHRFGSMVDHGPLITNQWFYLSSIEQFPSSDCKHAALFTKRCAVTNIVAAGTKVNV
jgi:hypothetical protein